MKNVNFNLIQREEMARNLWVYLCTQQGVKSAKSMSAGSEAEGRVTEGRASNEHPMSIHSASIQHPLQSGGNKVKTSLRFLRYVAMIFAVLVMSMANVGMAWGANATFSGSNLNAAAGDKTVGSITLSTSNMTYSSGLYASSSSKSFTLTASGGATISQILITMSGTSNRYSTSGITNCTSCTRSSSVYTCTISPATSSVTCTNSGGGVTITQLEVTYSGGASTKRIYMKAGEWKNDNPYFYAHSWGSSNSDVLMTLADCETDVYYADIPSGNTSVLFTRQSTNSGIKYKDQDGNWNQSADITISTNNKFTFSAWNGGDGKSTFTGGTYSAPTYTISFAANGGSGSMSSISSIACGDDQALPANEFTYAGHTFAGWHADVATTVSGSPVAAGSDIADEATLQNITSNITLTAQWEENSCPESGTVYSASTSATGDISIAASASNLALNTATHKTTVTGGTMSVYNGQSSAKNLITANGFAMPNNNTYFRIDLDCPLETGDVISVDVGKNADERGVWITTASSRPGSAPACALTATGTGSALATVTYTVTGSDAYHGNSTFYIYRATGNGTNFNNISITRTASCGATQPGAISKGSLSGCSVTLTAAGSAASNNTWYWQASSTGTSTSESGATKDVTAPGTYYIRSYYSTGTCWSDAREVTVSASDLTPAAPTNFTAGSISATGATFSITDAGNASSYDIYYSTSSTAPTSDVTTTSTSKSKAVTGLTFNTTYYAWVRAVCGSNKSDWVALSGSTFTTSNTAPTSASISPSNGWIYVPGEEITLTASAETTNASTTYTWYRGATIEAAKAAGAIQAAKTAAAGGTTYTIAECEAADAYKYWVEISNGTGYETSTSYDIKIYTFFLYDNTPSKIDDYTFSTIDRVNNKISVTIPLSNINYTYQFKVSDGLGTWYGCNDATITGSHAYWDGLNSTGANVGLTSSFADDYKIDYYYNSNNVVVTYPVHNQAEDVTVYFDNRLTEMENMYIRIGHDANSKASSAFTLVPGTANLYVGTTTSFNDFHAWSIADNTGWTGTNTIYQPWYDSEAGKNKPDDEYAITKQTNYQRYVVDETISIIPTSENNTEYGCTYWNVDKVSGMKRDRVTITAPVNGTVTVNYTSEEGVASSFLATTVDMYQDLAHTVKLTSITAVANTGYDAGAITINGGAYSANYVVTGATTVAASFTLHNYNVAYNTPSNGNYTIKVASGSASSASKTATMGQTITLAATPSTGYHFTGWTITNTDSSTDITNSVSLSGQTENATFTMPAANISIAATFAINTYTVSFAASPAGYGSVDVASIASVNHGSTVSIASNVLTLKETAVTATATSAGADYTYAFSGWSVSSGASITEAQTITANFTRTANQYSVTHTLTGVTTSSGATGSNAATYGTDYTATFAVSSGYTLPNSVTVTAGGSDITASCTYTKGTGTVLVPGASITGNIVITVTGAYAANFQMIADASAGSEKSLSNGEAITQGSKNCTTLTGGTAVYTGSGMKVQKPSPYGWYFGSNSDVITISLTGHILKVGSVIAIDGNCGSSNNGIKINTNGIVKTGESSGGEFSGTYTVKAGDTDLIGTNVLTLTRSTGSATRMYSITLSNCQAASPCTTPTLPSLSNQAGCSYSAWNATPSNASTISAAGESISYSWKKGATEKATTASYTPDADGTDYTVTVTVSKAGKITTSVTSSALTATRYGNPSVTGPSDAEYEVGESASNLSVTATPDHDESLTYQWYSNTAKSTSSPTPTVLENCTTSTYKPSTAATGTTYYFCKVSGGCADVYSSIATVTVSEASCFKASNLVKNSDWSSDVAVNDTVVAAKVEGTITGGTIKNTGSASLGSNKNNANAGLVMDGSSKEVTVILRGNNHLAVGSVITLKAAVSDGAKSGTSKTCGLVVGGYDCSPASKASETAYESFTQSYTVTAGSSLVNASSFTIALKSGLAKTYLHTITVTGCVECTPIDPELSYSKTTIWMDDADLTATPSLDKDGSTGTVSYALTSATPSGCVTLNTTTGVVTAVSRGTATITATIAADGTHCGKSVSCNLTIKQATCGEVVIAGVTLTAKDAGTPSGSLIASSSGYVVSTQKWEEPDGGCGTGGKLGASGNYICLTLKSGEYFQNGDRVVVDVAKVPDTGDKKLHIYAGTSSAGDQLGVNASPVCGENEIILSGISSSTPSITLYRTDGDDKQNPYVVSMKVYRYACPEGLKEFSPTGESGNWSATSNWIGATGRGAAVPTISERVHVLKPVTVDVTTAKAERVYLFQNSSNTGSLTIDAGKELVVAGTLRKTTDGETLTATGENDIVFGSDKTNGLGALAIGSHATANGLNNASVSFYTLSSGRTNDNTSVAQYVGTPFGNHPQMLYQFYNSWMYKYVNEGTPGWTRVNGSDGLDAFAGYCVFAASGSDFWMQGQLVASEDQNFNLVNYDEDASNPKNENMLANSWMAPIKIAAFDTSDFTNAAATIYIFNSGSPAQYEANKGATTTGSLAGQYATYPINDPVSATAIIPSMQAFSVYTSGSSPKINLDYSKLVYDPAAAGDVAPGPNKIQRRAKVSDDPMTLMGIRVTGSQGWADAVRIYMREDFEQGFENGWDGHKMFGETTAPQLYAITPDGKMAINCIPTFEGTVLGFQAGTDDNSYTFSFTYEGDEALYLNDLKEEQSTLISSENTYQFFTADGDLEARFIISATPYGAPEIATGVENTAQGTDVRKVIINDKMFIIRGGRMYDATGVMVR